MNENNGKRIIDYTNEEIIQRHLDRYKSSPESIKTRKTAIKYFFHGIYFNFNQQVSKISKSVLMDYFDWLNNKEDIALSTKKLKWTLLCSLLEFCMEYYDDFLIKIPSKTINWNQNHKIPESNKNIRLEFNELETILGFLKINNFKYYLIFRIFADTGMRKGELVNIDYDKVNTKKRLIDTHGKKGRKIYYITKELANYLEVYINSRKKNTCETKALFLTKSYNRYAKRQFNYYLKSVIENLEIEKNITCKTFRSTLNTLRKVMGCPNEDRKILINHQTDDVNVNHYLKLKYEEFVSLFDKWYPYQNLQL